MPASTVARPRTSEDFYLFCTYVLEYEKYDSRGSGESDSIPSNPSPPPPLDSSGSSVNSESTNSSSQEDKPGGDDSDEGESLNLVTCFCGKPFARRPMIECSICLTWIHLSCARIRKTQIPEVHITIASIKKTILQLLLFQVFHCAMCKSNKHPRSPSPDASDRNVKRPKRSS